MPDLFPLIKLHRVDERIVEIRKRAAAWDPGRALTAEVQRLTKLLEEAQKELQRRQGEVKDLELKQNALRDQRAKYEKQLYSGKVVNPREVEAMQKEIDMLARHADALDAEILAAADRVPEAQQVSPTIEKELSIRKRQLAEHRKAAEEEKQQLEQEFKALSAERPGLVEKVDRTLLAQYDAIRKRHDGIGMSQITEQGTCERCKIQVPAKTVELALEGKVVTCEGCHRLLYRLIG